MTKSGYVFALLLLGIGAGLIAFNSKITGYVTGSTTHESSFLIVLLGLVFVVTAALLIIATSFKIPNSIEEENSSIHHKDLKDFDEVKAPYSSDSRFKKK